MKKILLILSVTLLFSICITADVLGASVTAEFDAADMSVTLSGMGEGIVSIRVSAYEKDGKEISTSNLPTLFHQIEAEDSYTYTFYMPDNSKAGKYNVYVADINGSGEDTFINYSFADANTLLKTLEGADSKTFINTVLNDENAKRLGIDKDSDDYSDNTIRLMNKLYDGYEDANDFLSKYNFCNAVNSISGKENDIAREKLQKYSKILNLDYKAEFEENEKLTENAKRKILNLLSQSDYSEWIKKAEKLTGEKDFNAFFKAYCALGSVKATDNWMGLKNIYTEEYEFLNENVIEENKDSDDISLDDAFVKLSKMTFEDIEDLKDNFDKAVESVKPKKNTSSSGSGTSGGSGGGGGFSVGTGGSSKEYETLPEVEKDAIADGGISFTLPQLSESGKDFSDVSKDSWYFDAVSALSGSGIISGYENGNFMPQNKITRAEFTKIIVSAFSLSAPEGEKFSDVSEDAWYKPFVNTACGAGVINGYGGAFNPQSYITREDAVVILGRVAKLFKAEYTGYKEFNDMNDVSSYALTTVGAFYQNKIISGKESGGFMPKENITRAETAQLIVNFIKDISEKSKEVL